MYSPSTHNFSTLVSIFATFNPTEKMLIISIPMNKNFPLCPCIQHPKLNKSAWILPRNNSAVFVPWLPGSARPCDGKKDEDGVFETPDSLSGCLVVSLVTPEIVASL